MTGADTIERARLRLDANLAALDGHVPCRGPQAHHWTSDDRDERAHAAELCKPCTALSACAAYADAVNERWHVWGGRDRSTK